MKLISPTGFEVPFGMYETPLTLCNAVAALKLDHPIGWELKLESKVKTCGWTRDPKIITFGTLHSFGVLHRSWERGMSGDPDDRTIIWDVTMNVTFTDTFDHPWKQGDRIEWPK